MLTRNDAGFKQALGPFEFLFGVGEISRCFFDFRGLPDIFQFSFIFTQAEPCSCLGQHCALLLDGQFKLYRDNAGQNLPLADAVADIDQHLIDAAFNFRTDSDFIQGKQRANRFDVSSLLLSLYADDFNLRLRRRNLRLRDRFIAWRILAAGGDQYTKRKKS
ncbi:MAG: hypothetical protein IPJ07_05590 [Acidobacteria bacterium]|nr:hypothetical protein [Acidobacteriota bacterium]